MKKRSDTMSKNSDTSLSRFISLILRHRPEEIGLTLDKAGWADTKELIEGISRSGQYIDMDTLERIVREDSKGRYSFNEDKSKIRANQGHSIPVEVEMSVTAPPERLYHGTAERFLDSIRQEGIRKMSRLYVHLSPDAETAFRVGSRHGKPVVLVIDTAAMLEDGYVFRLSDNGVWQSEDIPWRYVCEVLTKSKSRSNQE